MYATKRRQRNFKRVREAPKPGSASNPSKRHRERLNSELETTASLLPYDQAVISRLDKLSVLRLAVSYLQVKAHFQVALQRQYVQYPYNYGYSSSFNTLASPATYGTVDKVHANESTIFKALSGFVLILNENGEIYYASDNIETYLGFHQSDILHQPVYDMIHSEDREEIRQQLHWNYSLPPSATLQDLFSQDGLLYLERSASARFRCLLDNTCGFLRIDIRGKLAVLHGLPHSYVATRPEPTLPVMGLVAVCCPFVPPPNLDGPDTEPFLKTKHALDFSLFSLDNKAKYLLETDEKTLPISFYQLVHIDDAACLAEAHKEVIKNGASGLLVYRMISTKSQRTYWLQSSCRLFYKNGKPESIGCTHRLLTEAEGLTLLEKRASLSAKLLSFDDSLLQSPKLLQSTAALSSSASTQKLKTKRTRPPTVTTVSRDPRAAGALQGLLALPQDATTLALQSLSYLPQQTKHSANTNWRSTPTYYSYLPNTADLYAKQGTWQNGPSTSYYTTGEISPNRYITGGQILQTDRSHEWSTDAMSDFKNRQFNYYNTAIHNTDSTGLLTQKTALASENGSGFNFSISEVTNTLLGQ